MPFIDNHDMNQWRIDFATSKGENMDSGHEIDYLSRMKRIEEFMDKLVQAKELVYTKCSKKENYALTPIGKELKYVLKIDVEAVRRFLDRHALSPYFTLFTKWKYETGVYEFNFLPGMEDRFNEALANLRRQAKEGCHFRQVRNARRQHRKLSTSILEYVDGLTARHARLLAVRLDLGFSVAYRQSLGEKDLDPAYVRKMFSNFLDYMRDEHPACRGYLRRLEYGLGKSFHYHVLLLFDGNMVREDVSLGHEIGLHWQDRITNKKGTYYNCNRDKDVYRRQGRLGIGMVHYADEVMRTNLQQAALYLAKVDYYIRLKIPGIRSFSKGQLKGRSAATGGRPRGS